LGIEEGEKLIVISEGEHIVLKKVDASIVEESFRDVLEPLWEAAENADLDADDAADLVYEPEAVMVPNTVRPLVCVPEL